MSIVVPLDGFGAGGGASLNFKIVGNPQPETAKDNTIWVDTDVKITGWDFNAAQPETAEEGLVWFATGTSSPTAFNALKRNGIQVYPISAKQYVSGAWVNKDAKIYQNGTWADLARLPSEYQEVAYIQSTGTQYLNPEFLPDTTNAYRYEFKFNAQNVSTEAYLMGFGSPRYSLLLGNSKLVVSIGDNTNIIEAPVTTDTDYAADITIAPTSLSVTLNGTSYGTKSCAVKTLPAYPYLFARNTNNNGAANSYAKTKLYYWRIYKNDTLVRELVPCYRKSDSAAGMYDVVTGKFYTNSGTGTFVVGGDAQ